VLAIAAVSAAWLLSVRGACAESAEPISKTVIGPTNPDLVEGSVALQSGEYERGVELTLAGLARPTNPRDRSAGLANLCAGYVALRQYDLALVRCSQALAIDPDNWRALNNRAGAWLGLGERAAALTDLRRGLAINPDASTLQRSLEIVLREQQRHEFRERAVDS
jgi:tetratricopeptide (TPR) repeat protein